MEDLPSGIVTFLYTDIEGSSLLWERDASAMRQSLEQHNAILDAAITTYDGVTYKLVGDSYNVAFAHPVMAVQAAIEIQRKLSTVTWGDSGVLRVRIGLHTGPAELQGAEYVSHTLNRVTRVMSAAHGGQILLTSDVAELVNGQLPQGSSLRDMGQHYLKGLTQPEHLFQLVVQGMQADFPPLLVTDLSPHNLPVALTRFIGRDAEIPTVGRLLHDLRLVTLTGSGGVGKTRLAIEVGRQAIPAFSNGVWLIELASLTDPQQVTKAVADILGIHESEDRPLLETLKDYLRNKRSLLILDNCEHLIDACARAVDDLLHTCPLLTVLATSREALGLPGERLFLVPNLSLPDAEIGTLEQLLQSEAIQLFIDRARTALPGFYLAEDNLTAAVQICRRLDGIPLAIELAAARIKTLHIDQIAQRLDDRFRLLTGGSRTALPRQQTLRATIDWSYRLLSQPERRLLERLSVFSGGCTLAAAEAICIDEDIQDYQILDLLTSLVNRSMVDMSREQGREPRFRLLETVRQYAREKLFESDEIATYRDRHLSYFVEWAEIADPHTRGPDQAAWLERMDHEYENLMAALEWASESDPRYGLRLASALWWYSWMRNRGQECRRWLNHFLATSVIECPDPEKPGPHDPQNNILKAQRGIASSRLGFFLMMHPKHLSRAEELISESLAISRECGDQAGDAFALFLLGYTYYYGKLDFDAARSYFSLSLALYQSLGDLWGQGRNYYNLGNMEGHLGNTLSQCDYLEKSLAVCRQAGDLRGMAVALDNLAAVRAEVEGDLRAGRKMVEEAIDIYRQLKASGAISNALIVYGHILAWQGEYSHARRIFQELEEVLRQRGGTIWNVEASSKFGFMHRLKGNDEQALAVFEDCLAYLNAIDPDHKQYQNDVIEIMIELGLVLTRNGNIQRARSLFEEAHSLSKSNTPLLQAKSLHGLGLVSMAEVEGKAAASYLQGCLRIFHVKNYRLYAISALEDYAGALHLLSKDNEAARIIAAMATFRQHIGVPLPPGDQPRYERLLADLQAELGEIDFNQAWIDGQVMTLQQTLGTALDEALAYALDEYPM